MNPERKQVDHGASCVWEGLCAELSPDAVLVNVSMPHDLFCSQGFQGPGTLSLCTNSAPQEGALLVFVQGGGGLLLQSAGRAWEIEKSQHWQHN